MTRYRWLVAATGAAIIWWCLLAGLGPVLEAPVDQYTALDRYQAVGYAVSGACFLVALLVTMPRTFLPMKIRPAALALWLFALWILFEPLLRDDMGEFPRSVAAVMLYLSADYTGRWLASRGLYVDFFGALGRLVAVLYCLGFALAVLKPSSAVWSSTMPFLGDAEPRAYFFWLLNPLPVLAVCFLLIRRNKWAVGLLVGLVALTRTRTYILQLAGFGAIVYFSRKSLRTAMIAGGVTALVMLSPTFTKQVGDFSRLSALTSGVDPVSGRTDPTDGRADLTHRLLNIYGEDPIIGVGAQEVRDRVHIDDPTGQGSNARTENGVQFLFASYGSFALLFLIYIGSAFVRALRLLRHSKPEVVYLSAATIVMVLLSPVSFFGTASGLNDWLALVVLSVVLHLQASRVAQVPQTESMAT